MTSISLRPATHSDGTFVESVYFETHRWIIEKLFGWRGDDVEHRKFAEEYRQSDTSIVIVDGQETGWLAVRRFSEAIQLDQIFLSSAWQNRGIGTALIERLIDEARRAAVPIRLSTAKINPARRLYERLGFRVLEESELRIVMELS